MTYKRTLGAIIWIIALITGITMAQPALTLSSVNPATVTSGQLSTLTVTGTGFVAETAVQIIGMDGIVVNIVNDTTLTIAIPSSAVAGTYSLSALNPDSENTTLSNAFTVVNPLPTETPQPTATPTLIPLTITHSEPQQVNSGQANTLSVLGLKTCQFHTSSPKTYLVSGIQDRP